MSNHELTTLEASRRWGVSERRVDQYCAEGRVPGARKVGGSWLLPPDAEKPRDLRQKRSRPAARALLGSRCVMPLMNTPFHPGEAQAASAAMEPGPQRDIAQAEYHYFSGHPEAAALEAEPYLHSQDQGARLSASLIFAFSNLSLGRILQAKRALARLQASLGESGSPELQAAAALAAAAGTVLLHLPQPSGLPEMASVLPLLPPGLRAFAMYLHAHGLYLQEEYAASLGAAEATLAMGGGQYPIPAIYLHLVAVMDAMSLVRTDTAKAHLLAAWELARPDDLIEGFGRAPRPPGRHAGVRIKPAWPRDFQRVIEITYRFSAGLAPGP